MAEFVHSIRRFLDGTGCGKYLIELLYHCFFFGNALQIAISRFVFAAAGFHTLHRKACWGIAAQPAPVFGKLHHIIGNTLGQGVTLKFSNDGEYLNKYL